MYVEQRIRIGDTWRTTGAPSESGARAQLALAFGPAGAFDDPATWAQLTTYYPHARIAACSTAGEIADVEVHDDVLVVTALALDHGHIAVAAARVDSAPDSYALAVQLAAQLPREGLVHVLVISDGTKVNGTPLVAGFLAALPAGVGLSGGLAGDGARFARTVVCLDGPAAAEQVVAIGFYGEHLRIGCGSRGGWNPFGPERVITKAVGNVLHELDGQPALDLYKRYLGEQAAALPSSALLFPLAIRGETGEPVVRTVLSVDEEAKTMCFAGDVPTGYRARLMTASFDRLVDGAHTAAQLASGDGAHPDLAILISCVGRKLVLKQRIDEELEVVRDELGPDAVMTGFYSYGEIAPFSPGSPCELHNQTMTITTISER